MPVASQTPRYAILFSDPTLIRKQAHSERVTLARDPVRLAFADDLLAEPFSLEAAVQDVQIRDDILAGPNDSLFGCDCAVGLNAEFEGREERVRDLVGGKDDVLVLEEAL